jgi:hypothetical protein
MGWKHEQDPQRKGRNNPETKPEHPPKRQPPSEDTLRRLGRSAIRGGDQKR